VGSAPRDNWRVSQKRSAYLGKGKGKTREKTVRAETTIEAPATWETCGRILACEEGGKKRAKKKLNARRDSAF